MGPQTICPGPECPQVQQAKSELRLEVSRLLSVEVAPLVMRMEKATIDMAVHAERLTVGAAQFKEQKEAITRLEAWRNQSIGLEKAGRKAGAKWAVGASAVIAIVVEVGKMLLP